MTPNPALGVFFHWLGGLASGSFYVPYRGVKRWSWETYWLVGGVFSWIIAPWLLAGLLTKDLPGVLRSTPGGAIFWCYFFGLLWGIGGLTFGLTMRFLGLSLGMAIVMGLCAAFGTLMALEPAIALTIGAVVLGQTPEVLGIVGIVLVVTAGVGAARSGGRDESGVPPVGAGVEAGAGASSGAP